MREGEREGREIKGTINIKRVQMFKLKCKHANTHTYMDTYIQAYIQAYIHTY